MSTLYVFDILSISCLLTSLFLAANRSRTTIRVITESTMAIIARIDAVPELSWDAAWECVDWDMEEPDMRVLRAAT